MGTCHSARVNPPWTFWKFFPIFSVPGKCVCWVFERGDVLGPMLGWCSMYAGISPVLYTLASHGRMGSVFKPTNPQPTNPHSSLPNNNNKTKQNPSCLWMQELLHKCHTSSWRVCFMCRSGEYSKAYLKLFDHWFNGHADFVKKLEALEVVTILPSFKKKQNLCVKHIFSLLFVVSKADSTLGFFSLIILALWALKVLVKKD